MTHRVAPPEHCDVCRRVDPIKPEGQWLARIVVSIGASLVTWGPLLGLYHDWRGQPWEELEAAQRSAEWYRIRHDEIEERMTGFGSFYAAGNHRDGWVQLSGVVGIGQQRVLDSVRGARAPRRYELRRHPPPEMQPHEVATMCAAWVAEQPRPKASATCLFEQHPDIVQGW